MVNLRLRDQVTPALKQLHWLPVASRIMFKLCLFMHLIHLGWAPQYLVECVQLVNTSPIRHLRSSDTTDYLKRTTRTKFGKCGFSYSGSVAWNSLPPHLCTITDTNAFKRHLKSFLFTETFSHLVLLDKLYSSAIQITDCIVLYQRLSTCLVITVNAGHRICIHDVLSTTCRRRRTLIGIWIMLTSPVVT